MMEHLTRVEAQARAEEIKAFALELTRLETAQVVSLSDEQHRSIKEHHQSVIASLAHQFDIDRDVRSKQLSLGMRIASLLGALALATSVFFLNLTEAGRRLLLLIRRHAGGSSGQTTVASGHVSTGGCLRSWRSWRSWRS